MRKHVTIILGTIFSAFVAQARYSIVVDDGFAYATHPFREGFALSVYDVERPEAPVLVKTLRARGTPTTPVTISGDVGYVGNDDALHVIDLTCPGQARFIRTLRDGYHDSGVTDARAVGSSLLVGGNGTVRLYDISDPFSPVPVDMLPADATTPLAANHRFTPLFTDGACRIHEMTPDGFVGRGLAGIASNSTCFFVSSSVLYEADRTSVRIHDLSVPANPQILPFTNSTMRPVPSYPRGRLWVARKGRLEAWNVWKPLEPRFTYAVTFPDIALLDNAYIRGSTCYVNDRERNSLRVFSLSSTQAVEISECPFPAPEGEDGTSQEDADPTRGRALPDGDVVTDGTLLFATAGTNGAPDAIGVYDVSRPGRIVPRSEYPMERPVVGLAIYPGTNLLFAVDGHALRAFSFSRDGRLEQRAELPVTDFEPYGPQAVAIDPRGFALLACRMDGIKSLNLAQLSSLAITDAVATDGFARDIACSRGHVYVSDDTAGVTVFSLSGDGALDLFRTIPLPYGSAAGLGAMGALVYVAAQELPLALFTDRPHPQCVGLCEADRDEAFVQGIEAIDVSLVENRREGGRTTTAFVIDAWRGLVVCDVTSPRRPRALGLLPRKGTASPRPIATASHGASVYFLTEKGGVLGLDGSRPFVVPAPPPESPSVVTRRPTATTGGRP